MVDFYGKCRYTIHRSYRLDLADVLEVQWTEKVASFFWMIHGSSEVFDPTILLMKERAIFKRSHPFPNHYLGHPF